MAGAVTTKAASADDYSAAAEGSCPSAEVPDDTEAAGLVIDGCEGAWMATDSCLDAASTDSLTLATDGAEVIYITSCSVFEIVAATSMMPVEFE